jgi:hypothetical protein
MEALRTQLEHGAHASPQLIEQTGGQLRTSGIPLLDLARLHEGLLVLELLPACPARKRATMIRNAKASRVDVTIRREPKFIPMEIIDDGKALQAQRALLAGGCKGLGLLGMRERVEMVGGSFAIETKPGEGTKITARIPASRTTEKKWREVSAVNQPEKP